MGPQRAPDFGDGTFSLKATKQEFGHTGRPGVTEHYASDRVISLGAVQRLRLNPGFSDTPDSFTIDLYEVDQDNWSDSFVTMRIPQAEQEEGNSSP
jgi:hypothetical protein